MSGYGSDSGFDDWLTANGYSLPSGSPTNAVLRERGSVYIDGTYETRFPGTPTGGASQERSWPRTDAEDRYGNAISGIPDRVVNASYQAAWLEANTSGVLSKTYTPGTEKVLTEVKGIKWSVVGKMDGSRSYVPVSSVIEGLLAPILTIEDLPGVLVV